MKQPGNLADAKKFFAKPLNSRNFLIARRWPTGIACPVCGSKTVYPDAARKGWECASRHANRKFTLKTGTLFEDSALSLDKWLIAIWLVANDKDRAGSTRLAAEIGVTQKTAWGMLQRINLALDAPGT